MEPQTHYFTSPSSPSHRIVYYEWGNPNSRRVAVCAHGLTRNGRDFDFLAHALAAEDAKELPRSYRVFSIDVTGRGKSEWLEDSEDYTYAHYLRDIVALLDHLNIVQCDWIGTSMGGIIGMMLCAFYPGRVGRLVLNDIGAVVAKEGLQRITRYVGACSFPTREEAEAKLRDIFSPFGVRDEDHWRHIFDHGIVHRDGAFTFAYDPRILDPYKKDTNGFANIEDIDLTSVWGGVQCPVLLLRGAKSDILRRSTARKMRAFHHATTLVEFPRIGHAPMLMEKRQIGHVTAWLARAPKRHSFAKRCWYCANYMMFNGFMKMFGKMLSPR